MLNFEIPTCSKVHPGKALFSGMVQESALSFQSKKPVERECHKKFTQSCDFELKNDENLIIKNYQLKIAATTSFAW